MEQMTPDELEKVWEFISDKKMRHPTGKHGTWVEFKDKYGSVVFGRYNTGRLCVENLQEIANWKEYVSFEDEVEGL